MDGVIATRSYVGLAGDQLGYLGTQPHRDRITSPFAAAPLAP